ncbi:sugar transferase [Mesorhizobium abyssinicae]|uniref:sugar transferase n=2 Tax=Mesorhizobium abyssinicae TaxID=1209958 RepID=UPI003393157D
MEECREQFRTGDRPMTTNAFEKPSHQGTPIWVQPFLPEPADSRAAVLHAVPAPDPGNAGAVLTDLSSLTAGTTNPPLGGLLKRIMDLAIAITALVVAAPVMIVVALLIRITAGGPAVFSHSRVGFGGKPFNCYKFRSMVANSEEVFKAYLEANPHLSREWEETHKIKDDPRITTLGWMLRKSSLDELPQLFNVIRGDMSCVGPRPIVKDELRRYGDHLQEYLRTRPGLTGLWQVSGRSSVDYASRVAMDSEYVRNWSVWLDLVILFRTIFAVMRFDRAS